LIWVGGLVTTYDAGMAVPDWPTTFGYNLFRYPWTSWISGPWDLFIEHGHRLLGASVGLLTLFWIVVTVRHDDRRWMWIYSLLCLLLVIGQGVLGGARVLLDEVVLARLHGCLGPLFFVACVAGAGFSSSWWQAGSAPAPSGIPRHFHLMVWLTAVWSYVQLVLGSHLRHLSSSWSPATFQLIVWAHLLAAMVLLVQVGWLAVQALSSESVRTTSLVARPVLMLCLLVTFQLLLGAAVWRVKYQWPNWVPQPAFLRTYSVAAEGMLQTVTVTAHVAIGSLICATSVLLAMRTSRRWTAASTAQGTAGTAAGARASLAKVLA
jgi:cytochrome c oxidase assembly protein subunit 15